MVTINQLSTYHSKLLVWVLTIVNLFQWVLTTVKLLVLVLTIVKLATIHMSTYHSESTRTSCSEPIFQRSDKHFKDVLCVTSSRLDNQNKHTDEKLAQYIHKVHTTYWKQLELEYCLTDLWNIHPNNFQLYFMMRIISGGVVLPPVFALRRDICASDKSIQQSSQTTSKQPIGMLYLRQAAYWNVYHQAACWHAVPPSSSLLECCTRFEKSWWQPPNKSINESSGL